jgi:hypothetical protein
VYANLQPEMKIKDMSFDLSQPLLWMPFFGHTYQPPKAGKMMSLQVMWFCLDCREVFDSEPCIPTGAEPAVHAHVQNVRARAGGAAARYPEAVHTAMASTEDQHILQFGGRLSRPKVPWRILRNISSTAGGGRIPTPLLRKLG